VVRLRVGIQIGKVEDTESTQYKRFAQTKVGKLLRNRQKIRLILRVEGLNGSNFGLDLKEETFLYQLWSSHDLIINPQVFLYVSCCL